VRTWFWAWISVALILVAVLGPGIYYWHEIGAHWARCIYGDPTCSLAVTTYALTALTGAAFIAAFRAAGFAKETIEYEKTAIVALNDCQKHRLPKHIDRTREFQLPSLSSTRFVESTAVSGQWLTTHFDCRNVGRAPVIDGKLLVEIPSSPTGPRTLDIDIGNLLPGKWLHVTVRFDLTLRECEFRWHGVFHKHPREQIGLYIGTAQLIGQPVTLGVTQAQLPPVPPPPTPPAIGTPPVPQPPPSVVGAAAAAAPTDRDDDDERDSEKAGDQL